MKKIVLGFLALLFITNTFAQKSQYVKQPSFGIHFFYNDFNTATALRTVSLGEVLRAKDWSRTKYMEPGFALSYIEGLGEHMDFAGTLSTSVMDNRMMFELVATANLKLTSDKHWVSPFITLGAGAQKHGGYFGALIPAGLGLQVNLWNEAFLLVNSQYRMPVTENVKYHLYHSIGIAGNLYKRKSPEPVKLPEVTPPPPPPVKDTDGDGITDDQDKCPEVKGLAKYNGCPIPDTDGDGVNDEEDKCPDVKGLVRYNGCPIPDTDGDGINDEEDKCPKEAGVAANFGCPEIAKEVIEKINMAAKDVFFATGSAKLLPKSSKSLDEIVKILKDNPTYSLEVNGYTDNTGTVERNLELSKERAASVVAYITSKGISADRLHSEGFGVEHPVADNKTAAGRAKNRRVEMIVKNY